MLAAKNHQHGSQHGEHCHTSPDEQPPLQTAPVEQQIRLKAHRQ
jgi:hypothetical protein